jgi:hypothetical protein
MQMSRRSIVTEPPERLMTLADLAEMLGVPVTTLYGGAVAGRGRRATG